MWLASGLTDQETFSKSTYKYFYMKITVRLFGFLALKHGGQIDIDFKDDQS